MSETDENPFAVPHTGRDWDTIRLDVRVALLRQSLETQKSDLEDMKRSLKEDYVCKHEFRPVMRLVYGMASLMLVAVVTAIVNSVLKVHL
jgi:hypothetical protein